MSLYLQRHVYNNSLQCLPNGMLRAVTQPKTNIQGQLEFNSIYTLHQPDHCEPLPYDAASPSGPGSAKEPIPLKVSESI